MGKFSKPELKNIENIKIGIVVSRFNEEITSELLNGALETLKENNINEEAITIAYVPGSMELGVVARALISQGVDGIICIGAVVRGDTPHFEYVSNATSLSIAQLAIDTGIPCIFGVLTVDNIEQAKERIGGKEGHKGQEAALSLLETVSTIKSFNKETKKTMGF
ncbi:MAG: 6,7-dimethyl-8-ribityllumazine synthase [Acidimicrobiia bacterium]